MAKRGRPKKYTEREKKLVKHFRNQIYYYGRKLAAHNFKYGYSLSLKSIRNKLSREEAYVLLDIFNDDDTYYNKDFRQVAVDEGGGVRDLLDRVSKRLGYGSIDEYEKSAQQGQNWQKILDTAIQEYEKLRNK